MPPPPPVNNHHIKLPAFRPNNIISWFAMAEGQFVLRNVNDELIRYYNVLTALPEATINFVEAPLPADPYTQLRARLLVAHQLTDYQKVEFIKKMPSLGAQNPSELFAEMLRVCPRGQEGNIFFIHEFLSRLPKDLRLMLSGMDFADRRALADRADELWTHTARQHHDVVAAVADEEQAAPVTAVSRRAARAAGLTRSRRRSRRRLPGRIGWSRRLWTRADSASTTTYMRRRRPSARSLARGWETSRVSMPSRLDRCSTSRTSSLIGVSSATQGRPTLSFLISLRRWRSDLLYMAPQAGLSSVGVSVSSL